MICVSLTQTEVLILANHHYEIASNFDLYAVSSGYNEKQKASFKESAENQRKRARELVEVSKRFDG